MVKNRKLVALNIVSSGGQVVIIAFVYFFLYKYLLNKIGVQLLGVWSVVLSTSSIASLTNAGITSSVVRYAAIYTTNNEHKKLKQLVFTASVLMLGLFAVVCAVLYPFAQFILQKVIPAGYIENALQILPFSILCFIINAWTGVYTSLLDGTQNNYIRSIIYSSSSVVLLIFSIVLIGKYGFIGLAYAQVIQSCYTSVLCMMMVYIKFKIHPFKFAWSKEVFKDIYAYGLKFQVISFASVLNDPLIKILLAKFGGLALTGYYEMANRLLSQLKGVIVGACQSLIPVMVNISITAKERLNEFYSKTFYTVYFISLTGISAVAFTAGIISQLWIGHYENNFVTVLLILNIAFLINLANVPAYFSFISTGNLNILIVSHLLMAGLNVSLGLVLGHYFSGLGVVAAYTISTSISSLYVIYSYHKKNAIRFKLPQNIPLIVTLCIFILLSVVIYFFSNSFPQLKFIYFIDVSTLIIFSVVLFHAFYKKQNLLAMFKQPI